MKRIIICLVAVIAVAFSSCKTDTNYTTTTPTSTTIDPAQLALDDAAIVNYLAVNKLTAKKDTASGLFYQIVSPGTGSVAVALTSNITVNYTGTLLSGTVFDQASSVSFVLGQLIKGWQIGLPFIRSGGNIILYIPSGLGYGTSANGTIPANSVLIFNISLLSVQ